VALPGRLVGPLEVARHLGPCRPVDHGEGPHRTFDIGRCDSSRQRGVHMMLIVAGTLTVDPALRDEFLAQRLPGTVAARSEPGCLDHILSADPGDPARLLVFERWASPEDLAQHLAASRPPADDLARIPVLSRDLVTYEVGGSKPLEL